jgi:hypothetical protein
MSQTLAAAPQRRSAGGASPGGAPRGARAPRPTLRVVRAPAAERGRTAFVVACLLLLVGGLLALLMINTALAQGSFTIHDLQARSDELGDREQALRQDIDVQAAPARLAARAKALGMVPSQSPAFLRLSDGKLLGVAAAAERPDPLTVGGGSTAVAAGSATAASPPAAPGTKKQRTSTATPTKTR